MGVFNVEFVDALLMFRLTAERVLQLVGKSQSANQGFPVGFVRMNRTAC